MISINDTDQINKEIEEIVGFKSQDEKDEFRAEAIHLDIIANVQELMNKRNISKADLAKELNTSKSYISQLFSADKLLNLKTIAKLERILNFKFESNFKAFDSFLEDTIRQLSSTFTVFELDNYKNDNERTPDIDYSKLNEIAA